MTALLWIAGLAYLLLAGLLTWALCRASGRGDALAETLDEDRRRAA